MKLIVKALVCQGIIALAACSSAQKQPSDMEAGMSGWVGKTYTEYIAARGAPKLTVVSQDGAKRLEYVRERILNRLPSTNVSMTMATLGSGVTIPVTQVSVEPGSVLTFTCTLVVQFSNKDILESYKVEGNDC